MAKNHLDVDSRLQALNPGVFDKKIHQEVLTRIDMNEPQYFDLGAGALGPLFYRDFMRKCWAFEGDISWEYHGHGISWNIDAILLDDILGNSKVCYGKSAIFNS